MSQYDPTTDDGIDIANIAPGQEQWSVSLAPGTYQAYVMSPPDPKQVALIVEDLVTKKTHTTWISPTIYAATMKVGEELSIPMK